MKIFAFVGRSQSGKTRLIQRLIPKLKERGHSVSVIKHCRHGFDLDSKGKDSWQFLEAGLNQVGLTSPNQVALLQKTEDKFNVRSLVERHFQDFDIVLIEGGRQYAELKKIEILRKGVSEKLECSKKELIGVVADIDVSVNRPVFHPDNIKEIVDFLESGNEFRKPLVTLRIDGVPVQLNMFVQKIFQNIALGMITSLKGVKKNPKHIDLTIKRSKVENEKL